MAIRSKKKLVLVGLGECGLATLVHQRLRGPYKTIGFSFDEERVRSLNSREAKFEEEALRSAFYKSRDFVTHDFKDLLEGDVFYLCLDDAIDENNQTIVSLIEALKDSPKAELSIIIRGTCQLGTTRKIKGFCEKELENKKISVLYIPCFETEGKYYLGEKDPYRIVIGRESKDEEAAGLKLYASLISKGIPFFSVSYEEAELSALASFSYFSLKSAFSYEVRKEGDKHGCDIDAVTQIIGADPRIGRTFLTQKTLYRGNGENLRSLVNLDLLAQVQEDRESEAKDLVNLLKGSIGEVKGKKIALIGLGNNSLLEESLAVNLYSLLNGECSLDCFDFSLSAEEQFKEKCPESFVNPNFFETVKDADAIMLLTPSSSLSALQEKDLLPLAKGRVIIDCCDAIDKRKFRFFDIFSPGKKPQFKNIID